MRNHKWISLSLVFLLLVSTSPAFAKDEPEEVRRPDPKSADLAESRIREGHPPPRVPRRTEPTAFQVAGDILFSRPVSAVHLVAGVIFLPLAVPVAFVLGDTGWALDICLFEPANYLFERPLGEI